MTNPKRREVLKRVLGAAAAPLVVPFSRAALGAGGLPPGPPTKYLNVLFHGLFAIVVWSDHIEVLAPDVSDHVYKAGTWLHEAPLVASQTYTLTGAAPNPRPTLDPQNHPTFHNWRNIDNSIVWCKLTLPFPDSISALRPVVKEDSEDFFTGTQPPSGPLEMLPFVTGLTYTVSGTVALDPLPWQPCWCATPQSANLHIWAEPDHLVEAKHAREAFERFRALFHIPTSDLVPNGYYEGHLGETAHDVNRPRGVEPPEEESFTGRHGPFHITTTTSPPNCTQYLVDNP